jgi:hypothetical protein
MKKLSLVLLAALWVASCAPPEMETERQACLMGNGGACYLYAADVQRQQNGMAAMRAGFQMLAAPNQNNYSFAP